MMSDSDITSKWNADLMNPDVHKELDPAGNLMLMVVKKPTELTKSDMLDKTQTVKLESKMMDRHVGTWFAPIAPTKT